MRHLTRWVAGLRTPRKLGTKRSSFRSVRLGLEPLEARDLLSATPLIKLPPIPEPGIEYPSTTTPLSTTDVVKQLQSSGQLAAPSGPTTLYLNFSGWANCPYDDTHKISAFTGSDRDEIDILYRTSEIFAPFNVEVLPLYGDGNYSTAPGSTTVFVGGNGQGNFTPATFCDCPSTGNPNGGTSHLFNSDRYDIALVDPSFVPLSTSDNPNVRIAAGIAHEAGHTFGLAHVRTDGNADYPTSPITGISYNPDLPPDVMSYDSNNDYFSNTAYNLTEANGSGVNPGLFPNYKGTNIALQNSFSYLQAVLGARPASSQIDVVDENEEVLSDTHPRILNLVDPGYYQQPDTANQSVQPSSIAAPSIVSGSLSEGDYRAYQLTLLTPDWKPGQALAVTPTAGIGVNLMIYDETAHNPEASDLVASTIDGTPLAFYPESGHTYALVVGGFEGQAGSYTISVAPLQEYLPGRVFTLRDANQNVTGHLTITQQIGAGFSGTFTPGDATATPANISGFVGGLVNGSSFFRFTGSWGESKSEGPTQERLTTQTEHVVNFTGQLAETDGPVFSKLTLTGSGAYTVTITTTLTDGRGHGTRTTRTAESLALVSGLDVYLTNSPVGVVGSTFTAQLAGSMDTSSPASGSPTQVSTQTAASMPTVAAVDFVMAQGAVARKQVVEVGMDGLS